MKVVLLKSPKDDDPYIMEFQNAGYQADCIPVLKFDFINTGQLRQKLLNPSHYTGLILTSQNSIEAIQNIGPDALEIIEQWIHKMNYVVGPATSEKASQLLLECRGKETGNADELSTMIVQDVENLDLEKSRFLYPKTNYKSGSIQISHAELDEISVYETIADPEFTDKLEDYIRKKGAPDIVVFYSPSGVDFYLKFLLTTSPNSKIVAIGLTTSRALEKAGVTHVTSAKPKPADLLDCIKTHLS